MQGRPYKSTLKKINSQQPCWIHPVCKVHVIFYLLVTEENSHCFFLVKVKILKSFVIIKVRVVSLGER